MSATTNILQWNPNQANQEPDATYATDPARTGGAVVDTPFASALANKLFYQLSTWCAGMANMLVAKGFTTSDESITVLESVLANIMTTADIPTPLVVVAFNATPTYNAATARGWQMILTGNINELTLEGLTPGQTLTFVFQQDATGGHTVTWPTNIFAGSAGVPSTTPDSVSIQQFYVCDDSIARPLTPMTSIPD